MDGIFFDIIYIIYFLILTIMVAHTGIALVGVMQAPGNILDWFPKWAEQKLPVYIADLVTCGKCISGQVALWTWIIGMIVVGPSSTWWGFTWVASVIVLTDQLMRRYGYA